MTKTKQGFRTSVPGFTLIELLVVIAIIGVLVGMLLPAIQKVRGAANKIACANNLHQLGLALHTFHDSNNKLPKGSSITEPGNASWGSSWLVYLLPYMEQQVIFSKYNLNGQYNNQANVDLMNQFTAGYLYCAASPLDKLQPAAHNDPMGRDLLALTNYVVIAGSANDKYAVAGSAGISSGGGAMFANAGVNFAAITDGTSNQILVSEHGDFMINTDGGKVDVRSSLPHSAWMGTGQAGSPPAGQWSNDNRTFNCTTLRYKINAKKLINPYNTNCCTCADGQCWNAGTNVPLNSAHPNGVQALFGDGSIHFLRDDMSLAVLQALGTRDDGIPVTLP